MTTFQQTSRPARSAGPRPFEAIGTGAAALLIVALTSIGPGAAPAFAQLGFTEFALTDTSLNSGPDTDFWIASAAPADVDADGDLDLLISGYFVVYDSPSGPGSVEDRLTLYRNDGPVDATTWALTPVAVEAGGLYFSAGDLAWGDYDNDGDPDVAVAGRFATTLYGNDGGTLVRSSTVLPEYEEDSDFSTMDLHSVSWADIDNDGDLDLLLPSVVAGFDRLPTLVLRNDGAGSGDAWTFTDLASNLPVAANAVSVWADMEGDGDLDLLLGNVSPYEDNFLETYRNDAGTLVRADTALAFIRYGTADWGDADNDGDLDIVYGGNMDLPDGSGESVVRILFNNGNGSYTPFDVVHAFESPSEPWLDFHAVSWADYDSDGDVDLQVTGEWLGDAEILGRSVVYANNGGTFTLASAPLPAPIVGNTGGAFTWFDLDGDGDLDHFVAGGYYVPDGNGLIEARTQLFRNDASLANAAPTAPTALQATPDGPAAMTLSWNGATDDRTPQSTLTYELEVALIAIPVLGTSTTIARALPEPGNMSRNTSWTLRGLGTGAYAFAVRAVDNAFNGGPVAQGVFTIGTTAVRGPDLGSGFTLSAARPNPSSRGTSLTLMLDREQEVTVDIHDAMGRRVAVLHHGPLTAGTHDFRLDRSDLPTGTYLVRAKCAAHTAVRQVTLLR